MANWNADLLSSFSPSAFTTLSIRSCRQPLNPISSNGRHFKPCTLPIRYFSLPRSCQIGSRKSCFASVSSSVGQQTSSVGVNPVPFPPPPSYVGSPLFWVGVGVGGSALFSWLASFLKKYAMQQAFKTMMGQMNTQNNQFSASGLPPTSPFPFPMPPMPPTPGTTTSTSSSGQSQPMSPSATSQNPVTVEIPATQVRVEPSSTTPKEAQAEVEQKKYSFVDVSPEDTLPQRPSSNLDDINLTSSSKDSSFSYEQIPQNGSMPSDSNPFNQSTSTRKGTPFLSLDALEKMMEDPTVQKMVYPYLPEEMRNPTTFKWMLQNPQYRQQLEEMLSNMSGNSEWDNRMVDSLKNFDLSSPEVKQQFDQIGLSPEEVISKIMANPEVAMAFQNPRVQQAIVECSQNPMNITKYQNDKEVMEVFEKISELFPGVGSP